VKSFADFHRKQVIHEEMFLARTCPPNDLLHSREGFQDNRIMQRESFLKLHFAMFRCDIILIRPIDPTGSGKGFGRLDQAEDKSKLENRGDARSTDCVQQIFNTKSPQEENDIAGIGCYQLPRQPRRFDGIKPAEKQGSRSGSIGYYQPFFGILPGKKFGQGKGLIACGTLRVFSVSFSRRVPLSSSSGRALRRRSS